MAAVRLGFNPINRSAYEDGGGDARIIQPNPILTPAAIGPRDSDLRKQLPPNIFIDSWNLAFREDFFDPVSRVRRGRFYIASGTSHKKWIIKADHSAEMNMRTFHSFPLNAIQAPLIDRLSVLLGVRDLASVWRILMIEPISTAELLFTLKSQSLLGTLPDIKPDAIPENERARVITCAEKVRDEAYKALPDSVIEVCKNLAMTIVTTKSQEFSPGRQAKELGDEADFLFQQAKERGLPFLYVVVACARMIARLHGENKANEQMRSNLEPPQRRRRCSCDS